VAISGVLTIPIGFTESGHGGFLQDESGGIALYLAGDQVPAWKAGTRIVARGIIEFRFSQTTIRVAEAADLENLGSVAGPRPVDVTLSEALEPFEARLVRVAGTVTGTPDRLTDAFAVDLRDGTTSLRVIVADAAGIPTDALPRGRQLQLTGVIGQRDSGGTGAAGYRLHLRGLDDIRVEDPGPTATPDTDPTPAPTARPTPTPRTSPRPSATPRRSATPRPTRSPRSSPTPRPSATPRPTPTPRPTRTPTPLVAISQARDTAISERITVEGTVTVEPGSVLDERILFIQDGTGGLAIRLARGMSANGLARGAIIQATGVLAAPYGNLELRLEGAEDLVSIGSGGVPEPTSLDSDELGEAREGILARVSGEIESVDTGSNGSRTVMVVDDRGSARVVLHADVDVPRSRLQEGRQISATGIVGQRESRSGAGDGYRIWPRDADDISVSTGPDPTPTPRPTRSPRPTATPRPTRSPRTSQPRRTRIRDVREGDTALVEGIVTAPSGLLDSDGRRVTIEDRSGGILLRLPEGTGTPRIGTRVRVTGEVATYYGAPQLEAEAAPKVLDQRRALPVVLRRAPGEVDEWRLVRVTVRIVDLSRSGESWRAEASLGAGGSLPVAGLADSGIAADVLEEGRNATITGIVKRAYPTASDQRYAVVPRFGADIVLGSQPARSTAGTDDGAQRQDTDGSDPSGGSPWASGSVPPAGAEPDQGGPTDALLVNLDGLIGRTVRVAGVLRAIDGPSLTLDDGTARATVRLLDQSTSFTPPLSIGEVLNVTGLVATVANPPPGHGSLEVQAQVQAVVRAATLASTEAQPTSRPDDANLPPNSPDTPTGSAGSDALRAAVALGVAGVATFALVAGAAVLLRSRIRRPSVPAASLVAPSDTPPPPPPPTISGSSG
jgi:hypothetical protein